MATRTSNRIAKEQAVLRREATVVVQGVPPVVRDGLGAGR
ncbi:MAG: hypothetical protein QOF38_3675 [Pseudonocardiales bacterium]|jgi:hypothetical protein|nr:hypothetical protein [Pseudonocardiales bacterium]MDT7658960.1 hypothetical protein [Pseudonocardiales bacterium]MDT7668948.1 hypothetical protein [Pseudonocardiales bacterium]MDT7675370.1 hypothetical protein [Pseudonocardiales bacterium]MDT7754054.1 hypothetical protein [Pseudonocardiales bacterium]